MAKGIASRNSLKALAHPLQQFLASWGDRQRLSAVSSDRGTALPAPYELAALRGEGILRQRFFGAFIDKLPIEYEAIQQIALWDNFVEDGGYLTAWVQRLGVAKALRREAALPADINRESRKLYCLLLDALAQEAPDLLPWAVEGYFVHVWRGCFPQNGPTETKSASTQTEVLRERLARALRKHYGETVEIKESFKEDGAAVCFKLLAKRKSEGKWEVLTEVERPRLKTARLGAYDASLELVEAWGLAGGK